MFISCVFLIVFLGIGANLLPTWMFVNSMQLIMHTALLKTSMPSNLHYFLIHYLNLLRMNPEQLDLTMETLLTQSGQFDYELSSQGDAYFNAVLNMCGYKHTISRNLTIIAGIFFLILLTVTSCFHSWGFLVDCRTSWPGPRRSCSWRSGSCMSRSW